MRPRQEIERDFNASMGKRRDEFLPFQREKILLEAFLDIRDENFEIIKLLKNDKK